MKALCPVLLLFLAAVNASGQAVVNSVVMPNLEVIEKEWRVEKHNPMLDDNPLRLVDEINQAEINRRTPRQNTARTRQLLPEPTPDPIPEPDVVTTEISTRYVYQVKFKNTGDKAIKTLTWDYVFSEPGTQNEVGRHRFVSKVNISPGKTKNLVMRTGSPPTGSINAKNAGKKLREQYAEQVVVQGIQYADGSVWLAAAAATTAKPPP